jgi:hypothetical protein
VVTGWTRPRWRRRWRRWGRGPLLREWSMPVIVSGVTAVIGGCICRPALMFDHPPPPQSAGPEWQTPYAGASLTVPQHSKRQPRRRPSAPTRRPPHSLTPPRKQTAHAAAVLGLGPEELRSRVHGHAIFQTLVGAAGAGGLWGVLVWGGGGLRAPGGSQLGPELKAIRPVANRPPPIRRAACLSPPAAFVCSAPCQSAPSRQPGACAAPVGTHPPAPPHPPPARPAHQTWPRAARSASPPSPPPAWSRCWAAPSAAATGWRWTSLGGAWWRAWRGWGRRTSASWWARGWRPAGRGA